MHEIDGKYVSSQPELLSVLYDLDLLPEQVKKGTRDYAILYIIIALWKSKKPEDRFICANPNPEIPKPPQPHDTPSNQ